MPKRSPQLSVNLSELQETEIVNKAKKYIKKPNPKKTEFFWFMYEQFNWLEEISEKYSKGRIELFKEKVEDLFEKK